jgi:hypothetical protein
MKESSRGLVIEVTHALQPSFPEITADRRLNCPLLKTIW